VRKDPLAALKKRLNSAGRLHRMQLKIVNVKVTYNNLTVKKNSLKINYLFATHPLFRTPFPKYSAEAFKPRRLVYPHSRKIKRDHHDEWPLYSKMVRSFFQTVKDFSERIMGPVNDERRNFIWNW
jgi:hypothetical protein